MREFKFRVWDKVAKKLLYFELSDTFYEATRLEVDSDGNISYQVEQFTGLKDKNGKDIYEGDLVKTWTNIEGVLHEVKEKSFIILFHEGCFGTRLHSLFLALNRKRAEAMIEVIGNIHEDEYKDIKF